MSYKFSYIYMCVTFQISVNATMKLLVCVFVLILIYIQGRHCLILHVISLMCKKWKRVRDLLALMNWISITVCILIGLFFARDSMQYSSLGVRSYPVLFPIQQWEVSNEILNIFNILLVFSTTHTLHFRWRIKFFVIILHIEHMWFLCNMILKT